MVAIERSLPAASWKRQDRWKNELMAEGLSAITYASWPKWRLFGFRADPEGTIEIRLGKTGVPSRVRSNYERDPSGSIRPEVVGATGRSVADANPLTGSSPGQPASWKDGETLMPSEDNHSVTPRTGHGLGV